MEMLDPANDMLPPPSSSSISSVSSSDLDTESTGSFFHDRSTTLGTLMGVSFPAITFRAPSQNATAATIAAASSSGLNAKKKSRKKMKKKRATASSAVEAAERRMRRRWWSLCKDGGAKPASLGDFLEVERRYGDAAFYGGGAVAEELEGVDVSQPRNGRVLFADGRVLPPAADVDEGTSTEGVLCRFPISLTGICSGGVG